MSNLKRMASGKRIIAVVLTIAIVTLLVPNPNVQAASATATDAASFSAALTGGADTIVLANDIELDGTQTLAADRTVEITSGVNGPYVLTLPASSAANTRHIVMEAGSTLTLNGVVLDGVSSYGGVQVKSTAENSSTLNVNDTTFQNCTTTGSGGAIDASYESYNSIAGVKINVTGTAAFTNNAAANGGAININGAGSVLSLNGDITLTGNRASGQGGAIASGTGSRSTSTVNITGTVLFQSNVSAGGQGGAIYLIGNNTTNIGMDGTSNIRFVGNKTYTNGGAIYQYKGDGNASRGVLNIGAGTIFDGNKITYGSRVGASGGHIYARSTDLTITGTADNRVLFQNGHAQSCGGALCLIEGTKANISYTDFLNNFCWNFGGAIDADQNNTVVLEYCTLEGNVTNSTGGGIAMESTNYVTIRNSTLNRNSAGGYPHATGYRTANGNGGGISFEYGSLTISDSVITNNATPRFGGGIAYNAGNLDNFLNNLTVTNTVFGGNTANALYSLSTQKYVDLHAAKINAGMTDPVYSQGKTYGYNNFDIQYVNDPAVPVDDVTVTYDSRGGNYTPDAVTVPYNTGIDKPTSDPVKAHNTFGGWETAEGNLWGFNTTPGSNNGAPVRTDMTLYARWTPYEYVVTFLNGDTKVDEKVVLPGATVEATTEPFSKDGHTFLYWADEDGNEWDFDTPINEDTTLYATWEADIVKVTFMNGSTVVDEKDVAYNTAVTATDKAFSKPGYTFLYWADKNGNEWDFNTKITSNTTLYAVWEEIPVAYTVTVNINPAGGGAASASAPGVANGQVIAVKAGEMVSLNQLANRGYVFSGWTVNSGLLGLTGNSFIMPAGNVVITANFTEQAITPEPGDTLTLNLSKRLTDKEGNVIGDGKRFAARIYDADQTLVARVIMTANGESVAIGNLKPGAVYMIVEEDADLYGFDGFDIRNLGIQMPAQNVLTFRVPEYEGSEGHIYITLINRVREEDLIHIPNEDPPLGYMNPPTLGEIVEIPADVVPLGNNPATGDTAAPWAVVTLTIVAGLAAATIWRKKHNQ